MSRTSTGKQWLLLLRWSLRDLRARWPQVLAIAMVIALGTGSYSGLSNTNEWRRTNTDNAYRELAMYDLRVRLAEGTTVAQGSLLGVVANLPGVLRAEERLIADIQVDASTGERAVLVPGAIYGVAIGDGLPSVNGLHVAEGRPLTEDDRGQPIVLLERNFAKHYELPASGTIRVSGGEKLDYVGHGLTPEFFFVVTERGGMLAEANFAAVFTSLETAQALTGRAGVVNDAVLTLAEPGNVEGAAQELREALREALPGVGVTVMTRDDDPAFHLNDSDIEGDQQLYDVFSLLIFGAAIVAAFNLIARVVDSQRREIGLSMALGVSPLRIAVRPLLVAAEIALFGVIFGIGVGIAIGSAMAGLLRDLQPLPQWETPFLFRVFFLVGLAGFLLPFVATIWPVWRAVSVPPVKAIQGGYRSARGGGLAPWLARLRIPGDTFARMPFRNVLRTPRRSFLTSLGIAAALAALFAFVAMIDSFISTVDRGRAEVLSSEPDRLEVALDRPFAVNGPEVDAIRASPAVDETESLLRVDGVITNGSDEIGIQIDLLAMDSRMWRPSLSDGERDRETPGIYLAELAARNLGVGVGDSVTLRHPRLTAGETFELVETQLPVLGLHPHPFRFVAYMDINHAGLMNLAGTTNLVNVTPAASASQDDVKRALFELPGVTSVQGVGAVADVIEDLLNEFVVFLRVIEGAMLVLAALIAFNSASISMDERSREHATMFAFGVPVRTVLRMAIIENLVIGVVGTGAGLAGGWILLRLLLATRVPDTVPDIDIPAVITPTTLAVTLLLGIFAVGLAPLLTLRRLRRTDIPAALKFFE